MWVVLSLFVLLLIFILEWYFGTYILVFDVGCSMFTCFVSNVYLSLIFWYLYVMNFMMKL